MASGDTKLSICSDALIMLGESPLTSFSGTDAGVVCDRLYDDIKKMTLAMYPWSFTISKLQLSKGTAPVNEYKYAYNLPTNLQRISGVRAVFNSAQVGAQPIQGGWEILGKTLITNQETIVIDFQVEPEEFDLPSYFVQLLKYMMTWHIAETVTDQITKAEYWRQIAVGTVAENMRGGYFRVAANIDGSTKQNEVFADYSLIGVRG
jgi:hypothetical protein